MKKWLTGLVIVAVLLLWHGQHDNETANQAVINVISQSGNQTPAKDHSRSATVANQITTNNPTIDPSATIVSPEASKERSFMAVYRDLDLAQACSHFYINDHDSLGDYDHLASLHLAAKYSQGSEGTAPVNQIEALERFYDQCLQLKRAVFDRAGITEDYPQYEFAYPVIVELRKEWQQTQPVTTAEKQLAQAVMTGKRWHKSMNQLSRISVGAYALNQQEREAIRQEVLKITEAIDQLYLQSDQVDQDAVNLLQDQIINLNIKKNRRLPVDQAARQDVLTEFLNLTNQLNRHLYTGNPDSFYEVIKQAELADSFDFSTATEFRKNSLHKFRLNSPEYLPPSQQVFALSDMPDAAIYNTLIEPASLLFICYLGDDCGPDSRHTRVYCLGARSDHQNSYPAACGQALVDFFADDYLSPNQWQDVQTLFNLLVSTYAP